MRLPVRFLRMNDTILVGAGGAVLRDRVDIQKPVAFPPHVLFRIHQRLVRIPAHRAAFAEGGYEPQTSPFTDAAEGDLTRQVVTFLQGVPR